MKRIFIIGLFLLGMVSSFAQMYNPVTWSFETRKTSETEYELIFKARIQEGSSLYSQHIKEGGPVPTTFTFTPSESYELIGDVVESEENRKTAHDDIFNMELKKFSKLAVFTQKIKVFDTSKPIEGVVNYMSCDDTQCTPPVDTEFFFALSKEAQQKEKVVTSIDDEDSNKSLYSIMPEDIEHSEKMCTHSARASGSGGLEGGTKSLMTIFFLGFLGGLLALLTPCVFPMIPLTVSFFTKKGGIKNAILYGFFIFMVYIVLSIPFHLLDSINPDILNDISTNVTLNIVFFVIFIVFAISFFGYFELTLPSSWMAKSTSAEGVGGILGIFFMALTLALVSFSCTGPILGSLLAGSLTSDGGAWQLTAGMAGFGLSLGLPFAMFAMFPNWLNKLPKSGGWLNSVKVVLGFLELALALKFLSNADLVKHWGLLKIEVFLALWVLIFAGLALYLFGIIRFPHDSKIKKLSFTRISLGVLVFAFTVYLASGFRFDSDKNTFKPLKMLSGLAPPVGYSILYPNSCPNNLPCFHDFAEGVAYAKKVNKPILLDFSGYACVNCRKMEEHVWPVKQVDKIIREEFVLISLYVDNKEELPQAEQLEVNRINGGTRVLENYGHKWAHFQTRYFNSNSQPFYVLLDSDGKRMLSRPAGYVPDYEEFATFLKCGLEEFK